MYKALKVTKTGQQNQRTTIGKNGHTHTLRVAPSAPQAGQLHCSTHNLPVCTTCKQLRKPVSACCALGHHASRHVSRRPQSQLCEEHQLPPCPRCTLKQGEVTACASPSLRTAGARFHRTPMHHTKKAACRGQHTRPWSHRDHHIVHPLLQPPSPSARAPVPQGLEEMDAGDMVPRPLFVSRHCRSNTAVT